MHLVGSSYIIHKLQSWSETRTVIAGPQTVLKNDKSVLKMSALISCCSVYNVLITECCKCLNLWDAENLCLVYCVKGKIVKMLQTSY